MVDETNPALFKNKALLVNYKGLLARGIVSGEYEIERGERLLREIQKRYGRDPIRAISLCSSFLNEVKEGGGLPVEYSNRLKQIYLDYLLSFSDSVDAREILASDQYLLNDVEVKHAAAFAVTAIFDGAYTSTAADEFEYSDMKSLYDLLQDSSVRRMTDMQKCYGAVVEMWRSTLVFIPAPFAILYNVMLQEEQSSFLSWLCDVREAALREDTFDSRVIALLALYLVSLTRLFAITQKRDKVGWKKDLIQLKAVYEWTNHGTSNLTEEHHTLHRHLWEALDRGFTYYRGKVVRINIPLNNCDVNMLQSLIDNALAAVDDAISHKLSGMKLD